HHALSFAVDDPEAAEVNGDDSQGVDGGQFLVEYASSKNAEIYPNDTGVLLQAGKKAMVQYHLHSIGEETAAEIELGIVLYPDGRIEREDRSDQLRELQLQLAPHLQLQGRSAAARSGRHHPPHDQLARQFVGEQIQPRPEELGGRRSADDRRNGVRVDRLVRP